MSRATAINAKCRDCICDAHAPGTWRQQTEGCTITRCALWQYRPKSRGKVRKVAKLASFQTERHEGDH